MNTQKQTTPINRIDINQPNFIHLKKKTFAEYDFIFHINDGYLIMELSSYKYKDQLLFQKINNKIKQMNLMLVDSIFPLILSDVVLDVLIKGVTSFEQYVNSKKQFGIYSMNFNQTFMKFKFNDFILNLLYSNISSEQICNGINESDKIYYLKKENEEIKYYSLFDQRELQAFLFQSLTLEINHEKSFVEERNAHICLRICFD